MEAYAKYKFESEWPYCRMYITMLRVDTARGDILDNLDLVDDVLDMRFDPVSRVRDVALWIQNLLWSIHKKVSQFYFKRQMRLLNFLLPCTLTVLLRPLEVQETHKMVDRVGCFRKHSLVYRAAGLQRCPSQF